MRTTSSADRNQQLRERDRRSGRLLAAGAAVTGALGYGIALGLARATEYAEEIEEDRYCREADVPPQR